MCFAVVVTVVVYFSTVVMFVASGCETDRVNLQRRLDEKNVSPFERTRQRGTCH